MFIEIARKQSSKLKACCHRWPCLLLTTCLLAACGSGTDSVTGGTSMDDPSSLSGRIVSADPTFDKFWMLDLVSGQYTTIPGTEWEEDHPVCDLWTDSTVFPSRNGDYLVETIDSCTSGEQAYERVHAVFVRDGEGTLLNSIGISTIVGGVRGPARISPNGELIALPVDFGDGEYRLTVFDWRNEEMITKGPTISGKAFDWLPDNRLIYANRNDVYVTTQDLADSEFLYGTGPEGGFPQDFAVSPDGQSLAMVVIERSSMVSRYGVPWIMDLNTLELRQLAHADDPLSSDETFRIEYPTWSPDGSKVALVYGLTRFAGFAELYVVPAGADNVLLSEDNDQVMRVNSWFTQLRPFDAEPE